VTRTNEVENVSINTLATRAREILGADREMFEVPRDLDLASYIDHTLVRPQATSDDVRNLCREAMECGFATVCVNPVFVPLAAGILQGSRVKAATVAGFPLGASPAAIKAHEAREAIAAGAREIDMVANIGAIKEQNLQLAEDDIRAVADACRSGNAVLKLIIETALLTDMEVVIACLLAGDAGAHFVKTSTGFAPGGATAADVSLMRRAVGETMGVKAAGGIRTLQDVRNMIRAGATRIGTSAGVQIVLETTRGEGETA
jgi:deoxyribose-phosphate aldolase